MRPWLLPALFLVAASACSHDLASSEPVTENQSALATLSLERVFGNATFTQPVAMMQAPGNASLYYVIEKAGTIKVTTRTGNVQTFADIRSRVNAAAEGGLLGFAFHPSFEQNGVVFLSFTAPSSTSSANMRSVIARGKVTANNRLDPSSLTEILTFDQPFTNHNGGQIAFGPDGMLYAGFGDGGSAGDPQKNGQKKTTLLGKMLRLDVDRAVPYAIPPSNPFADGTEGRSEIFAIGLRNPWRWSFDRVTGDLWVGDVGQDAWEEIDKVVLGGNYGWGLREGKHCYGANPCAQVGTDPVVEYGRTDGKSVTGGYVYRGRAIPTLTGHYIYGDFMSGKIWALPPNGAPKQVLTSRNTSSFAEDADGEVYVVNYQTGQVLKIVGGAT